MENTLFVSIEYGTPLSSVVASKGRYRSTWALDSERKAAVTAALPKNGMRVSNKFGFSAHSCLRCAGTKCGIILFVPNHSAHKNVVFVKCKSHGGDSHDTLFNEYAALYPNKDGFIGIMGVCEQDGHRFDLKSGTFNLTMPAQMPLSLMANSLQENYGSYSFRVGPTSTDASQEDDRDTDALQTDDGAPVSCYTGDAKVKLANGSWCEVQKLKLGTKLAGKEGKGARLIGTWRSSWSHPVQLVDLTTSEGRRLLITGAHPIQHKGLWVLPETLASPSVLQHEVWSVAVEPQQSIIIEGIEVATLGQSLEGLPDAFWGTDAVIKNLQSRCDWPRVHTTDEGLSR